MKINAVKLKEVERTGFLKNVPYIMDLTFSNYDFEKKGEHITGYSIFEINKIYYFIIYIYTRNGIVRIKFKYYY